jgi:hypothetical protein
MGDAVDIYLIGRIFFGWWYIGGGGRTTAHIMTPDRPDSQIIILPIIATTAMTERNYTAPKTTNEQKSTSAAGPSAVNSNQPI